MKYEILIHCHNFQHRLCWVLSSFLQQDYPKDQFMVNVATMKNNGNPTTESIIDHYKNLFNIKHTVIDNRYVIARPGLTKNVQIKGSTAEWIVCHSADCVVGNKYLKLADKAISGDPNIDCFGSRKRVITDKIKTNELVKFNSYIIEEAYEKSFEIEHEIKTYNNPGGHLFIRKKFLDDKNGGYFVRPERCSDWDMWTKGLRSRSEVYFKKNVIMPKIVSLPFLVHLNHDRDKEIGHHSEEQR